MNPKRSVPRSKVEKIRDKEYTPIKRILKEKKRKPTKQQGEKQFVMYKETPTRLWADISAETLQTRREWHDVQSGERKKPATMNSLPRKAITQI